MKRIPKYMRKQIEDAIYLAKEEYADWEIEVRGGFSNFDNNYWGQDLDDALSIIPSQYSHTQEGAESYSLIVKGLEVDDDGEIVNDVWFFDVEFCWKGY